MDTQQASEDRDTATDHHGREAGPRSFAVPRLVRDLLVLGAVCAVVLALVNAFVAQPFGIPSGSMEGTLRIGDRVVVDKLAYRFGSRPQRGDVVVFDGRGSFLDQEGLQQQGDRQRDHDDQRYLP